MGAKETATQPQLPSMAAYLERHGKPLAKGNGEWGTFKDNLRAPIHRWFRYPAGYSFRLIEAKIRQYGLGRSSWIMDPFVGCGTTSVVAKFMGVNSVGIEPHPFVFEVAKTKTYWDYDMESLQAAIDHVSDTAGHQIGKVHADLSHLPELVRKCYSPSNLEKLVIIRDTIAREVADPHIGAFLNLALTGTLRTAAKAATGWPYIAPAKMHQRMVEKDGYEEFCKQVNLMYGDLRIVRSEAATPAPRCLLIKGDARDRHPKIQEESIDLAITSPPYLNNYDYADRTRLETYFFGMMKTWRDITEQVRDRLMIAATTQIRRSEYDQDHLVGEQIRAASPEVYGELVDKVQRLSDIRLTKGGRKSYDIMVAAYFRDMLAITRQVYRVLKPGADYVVVLGDSAPYGVHIPAEKYLGELAVGVGFSNYDVELLRSRGGKWANNPQRHNVSLKESILTITK